MPSQATAEAFVAHVMTEDHVGAIRDWYAEDASMQENLGEPRVGREALMAGEQRALDRAASVKTELLSPVLVNGDTVAIHWRFTFTGHDGARRVIEEMALQTWRGDKVWREQFFYDPKQMAG